MLLEYKISPNSRRKNTMWLTSLADLLALLLAFFVLLFSMNEVKNDSWQDVLNTLGIELNDQVEDSEEGPSAEKNLELFSEQKAFDLAYLENILAIKIAASVDMSGVSIFKAEDRLVLSLAGESYFDPGSSHSSARLDKVVLLLGDSLRYIKNRVEVYGHTDPSQSSNRVVASDSNWGLSLARALSVADGLKKAGYGHPIRAFGMADTRFHELASIKNTEKRYFLARRVDIVIREAQGQGRDEWQ